MRNIASLIATSLLIPCATLSTQAIKPGSDVRVAIGWRSFEGKVRQITGDSLVIDTLRLPLQSINRVAVRRRTSNIGDHALYSGIGFGSFGLLLGIMTNFGNGLLGRDNGPSVLVSAAVAGGIGASLGAVFSLATARDHWQPIPLHRLRVSLAPHRDGRFAFGLSVSF